MKTIVVCGSRSITVLPEDFIEELNKIIDWNVKVFIGDAYGVDALCQEFFREKLYKNIEVYYSSKGKLRNNKGLWKYNKIEGDYKQRDKFMCDSADLLLALWDGRSPGTKANIESFSEKNRRVFCPGINIYSKTPGLGGALTNPTKISKYHNSIKEDYPVVFKDADYEDAEAAYKHWKKGDDSDRELMREVLICKLKQHPILTETISIRGGAKWISRCSHKVNGDTRWEGEGIESWFIQALMEAYVSVKIEMDKEE